MTFISQILQRCFGLLKLTGSAALAALMLLTVLDVIGRYFRHPILGSVELSGFLAVIVVAAALPYTYKEDGHVGVEIFTRLLPLNVRLAMDLITRTLTLGLFILITWQMFRYAGEIHHSGEVSMNLEFPIHIIIYMLGAGLAAFCCAILESIFTTIKQLKAAAQK